MKDIEKNDVNISKLFQWGAKLDLPTPKGDIEVWMKLTGDADVNIARVYALRRSADLRKKLRTQDTDERVALIPELDTTSKDKVIELLLTLLIKDLSDVAYKDLDIKYPVEPESTADLEEQEQYQTIVDNFPSYVEELTQATLEKEVNKERKRLSKLSMIRLETLYVDTMVEKLCESEMYKAFQDKTVYFSCYTDNTYTEPIFDNFEDYLNLPSDVKNLLTDFYGTLSIDIDNLKK